ncbi:hypothetical protein QQF64_016691 [Cirrhinus molitorella]|uniref:Uncharacterized protein n=1 Tax=Cirrhinus molitorella TaxID=172907 RepID=A0ABR3LNI1_9TELE
MSFISCATDLDTFSLMNPVTADPAAHQVHQSPTYCVRGIDGSLPGCKGENWGSLAPIIPQISKQLHVDEWVPPVTFCLTSPGRDTQMAIHPHLISFNFKMVVMLPQANWWEKKL